MTDQALTTTDKPLTKRSTFIAKHIRAALDLMIWNGIPWDRAAEQVGLPIRNMRLALERPNVLAYLRQQKHVLRETASAGNIHAYIDVRDNSRNPMARVQAGKAIDQLGDTDRGQSGTAPAQPGLVIQIISNSSNKPTINANGDLIDE